MSFKLNPSATVYGFPSAKSHDNHNKKYSLQFSKENELFLQSIVVPMLLDGASMNESSTTIDFYADSVKPLDVYLKEGGPLSYNSVIHMIWYLSKQYEYLKKNGYGFYRLQLNDILVVDDYKFICVNPENCKLIHNDSGLISFYTPFVRDGFVSPEILEIQCIPSSVSYKCFFYSLGALGIHCLFGINICNSSFGSLQKSDEVDETHLVYNKILSILTPILHTKLYWFFLKSLCIDNKRRSIMFL